MRNYYLKSLLILTITLTSCKYEENPSNVRGQSDAKIASADVHIDYLKCYARRAFEKKQCTDKLIIKYIKSNDVADRDYTNAFQFESEKQGFKYFINTLNLSCKSIEKGPEFLASKKAYLILCQPNNKYYMQFDYENNEWRLIE